MNRARRLFAALAVGLLATAVRPHRPYPLFRASPRARCRGPRQTLPADLGPGASLHPGRDGRVVPALEKAYAVIVHVGKDRTPKVQAVVGPIEDWPAFFSKVRATYWAHGPGEAYCARPSATKPGSCDYLSRGRALRPVPASSPPPIPPPPADGYAVSYSTQTGAVDPNSSALNDSAAAAAAGAASGARSVGVRRAAARGSLGVLRLRVHRSPRRRRCRSPATRDTDAPERCGAGLALAPVFGTRPQVSARLGRWRPGVLRRRRVLVLGRGGRWPESERRRSADQRACSADLGEEPRPGGDRSPGPACIARCHRGGVDHLAAALR